MGAHAAVEQLVREEFGRIVATLIRITGEFELAEDVVQEAFIAAMETWPRTGPPTNPRAWVTRAARNRAIDRIRRRQRFRDRQRILTELHELLPQPSPDDTMDCFPDDRLQLLFTCCHPALAMEARVALTLRTLGGLTADEIARAFFVARTTMQQRIVRAKQKIKLAQIPYRVPPVTMIADRLRGVLAVLYLIFNEGYAASSGASLLRIELADEAIRLTRVLRSLHNDPEIDGLLALMVLHHARRQTRVDATGELVLLEDQDRSKWDAQAIAEGDTLVRRALAQAHGPYALQAAIAAVHATAPTAADTDWHQIEGLYRLLLGQHNSPIIALNHGVAVAMAYGPAVGLTQIDKLTSPHLQTHCLYHSARAELLRRCGRIREATLAYQQALRCPCSEPERRFLNKALTALDA